MLRIVIMMTIMIIIHTESIDVLPMVGQYYNIVIYGDIEVSQLLISKRFFSIIISPAQYYR